MIWGWHGYDYACITLILAIHINNGCGAAQEYYANTGALKNAAETAQGGKKVGCSIVETFSKSTKPRELEEVLRLEYRSKLLNPKWAQVRGAEQKSEEVLRLREPSPRQGCANIRSACAVTDPQRSSRRTV